MKWISVKDRLPNKIGKYLTYSGENFKVTVRDFMAINVYSEKRTDHVKMFRACNGREDKHVTHWMPFPDAPKENE
jgi:hypothetical protein